MIKAAALFPVSTDNRFFYSKAASAALSSVLDKHNRVVVFVADHLNDYNRAMTSGLTESSDYDAYAKSSHRHLVERTRWVDGVRKNLTSAAEIKVTCSCDYVGLRLWETARRIRIAYAVDLSFRLMIDADVNRRLMQTLSGHERSQLLIREYLLEEIALNLTISQSEDIYWEYYAGGKLPEIFCALYGGSLNVKAETIVGSLIPSHAFYAWQGCGWRDVSGHDETMPPRQAKQASQLANAAG